MFSVLFSVVRKRYEAKNSPRSFLSLNSEHLAEGPALLMNWKSTEDRTLQRMTHCKQDGRHVPSPASETSAVSPCTVGGKLALVCSLLGATEHSVACNRAHRGCPVNINNSESMAHSSFIPLLTNVLLSSFIIQKEQTGTGLWVKSC